MTRATTTAILLLLVFGMSTAASARERTVEVEISNLSNAIYFTPLLVAAHSRNLHLFQIGDAASSALQAMAEGGDLAGLVDQVSAAGGRYVADPADGLLAPGASATATLRIGAFASHLSIAAMLLPTNDGFVGLDGLRIPRRAGVYTYYLKGLDAGTEANDERITGGGALGEPGIPADPGGFAGTGGSGVSGADQNTSVHVHRGVVGDLDAEGGPSDLDAGIHRWLNPVAKVTLTVRR